MNFLYENMNLDQSDEFVSTPGNFLKGLEQSIKSLLKNPFNSNKSSISSSSPPDRTLKRVEIQYFKNNATYKGRR